MVLDAESGRPILDASIRERHSDGTYEGHEDLTDVQGRFAFSDISGGLGKCPPVQLHISKEGYVPIDREFDPGVQGDTVRLSRQSRY